MSVECEPMFKLLSPGGQRLLLAAERWEQRQLAKYDAFENTTTAIGELVGVDRTGGEAITATWTLLHPRGFHARPSTLLLLRRLKKYAPDAKASFTLDGQRVGLFTIGSRGKPGSTLRVVTDSEDALEVCRSVLEVPTPNMQKAFEEEV